MKGGDFFTAKTRSTRRKKKGGLLRLKVCIISNRDSGQEATLAPCPLRVPKRERDNFDIGIKRIDVYLKPAQFGGGDTEGEGVFLQHGFIGKFDVENALMIFFEVGGLAGG